MLRNKKTTLYLSCKKSYLFLALQKCSDICPQVKQHGKPVNLLMGIVGYVKVSGCLALLKEAKNKGKIRENVVTKVPIKY